jgi:hypothetical protein
VQRCALRWHFLRFLCICGRTRADARCQFPSKLTNSSYNAAIFKIIAVSEYLIFPIDVWTNEYEQQHFTDSSRTNNTIPEPFLNLSNSQWRQSYDTNYVSQYGDLYLAVDQIAFDTRRKSGSFSTSFSLPGNTSANITARGLQFQSQDLVPYPPFEPTVSGNTSSAPTSLHIINGYTKKSGNPCRLQISLHFMIVVVAMNACKFAIMLYVLFTDRSEYIVTLGDAAASFLRKPDPTTKGCCMLNNDTPPFTLRHAPVFETLDSNDFNNTQHPRHAWLPRPQRYNFSVGIDKGIPAILS